MKAQREAKLRKATAIEDDGDEEAGAGAGVGVGVGGDPSSHQEEESGGAVVVHRNRVIRKVSERLEMMHMTAICF
jgi:hypothetical protein